MQCDICGLKDQQYLTIIEGSTLNVCKECVKFGKVIKSVEVLGKNNTQKSDFRGKIEIIESVVSDFSILVRRKRESMKQDHKDFASKLGIKVSILHNIETGQFIPDISTVKKMEKILNLRLTESSADKEELITNKSSKGMTIGDYIKINRN